VAVCSRIRTLSGVLNYRGEQEVTKRLLPIVDEMIALSPEISESLVRFKVPAGLPTWIGGLDHPEGLLEDFTVPDEDRRLYAYLYSLDFDTLLHEYFLGEQDVSQDREMSSQISDLAMIFTGLKRVEEIELLDERSFIERISIQYPERNPGEKYRFYKERCSSYVRSLGLCTVRDLVSTIVSSYTLLEGFEDSFSPSQPSVRRRIRDRRKHLFQLVPKEFSEPDSQVEISFFNLKNRIDDILDSRLVNKNLFVDYIGLSNEPSFSVTASHG
jgi:hypothetical protein